MMVRFVDIDGIEDYLSFHNKQSRSWRGVLDTTFMKFVSDIRRTQTYYVTYFNAREEHAFFTQ
jgi:hypothetical protein